MTVGPYCFNNEKFEPENLLKSFEITIKVIIEKSCGEVSLMEQDTIENVS